MAWRLAKSLETLRNQVNATYPSRSKVSDGTIGNAAHAATASDHNPNSQGVVCALDLTHDPAHGFDAHALAERLRVNRHPNLKYIISNSRIAGAWTNWGWQKYTGSNPHSKHIHVSVGNSSDGRSTGNYDDASNWNINGTQGGEAPMNQGDVTNIYRVLLGRDPDAGGLATYVGKSWKDVFYAVAGSQEYATRQATLNSQAQRIGELAVALQNEQNKPPKEVVKEVIKIVEKPVEVIKEVPALVDEKVVVEGVFKRFWNNLFKK